MAFVDVSGFTSLSERLATKGRAGAEEVTEVMNATFARLLDVAYAYGGGLLKFGGDALLLFFDGESHAPRAARLHGMMRKALRSLRTVAAPGGASPDARRDPQRPLSLLPRQGFAPASGYKRGRKRRGRPSSRTSARPARSSSAPRRRPFSTAATSAKSAPAASSWLGAGRARAGRAAAADRLTSISRRASPFPPRVPRGRAARRHRRAAVGFVRFGGIDGAIAADGPDDSARRLERLVEVVQGACDSHDVTFLESDIDRDGSGRIVLVAGAPRTAGDDEGRLLLALREIVDRGGDLPLQVGANRGRIFAGEVGPSTAGRTRSRRHRCARRPADGPRGKPGQILVAEPVLDRSRARISRRPRLEPFLVEEVAARPRARARRGREWARHGGAEPAGARRSPARARDPRRVARSCPRGLRHARRARRRDRNREDEARRGAPRAVRRHGRGRRRRRAIAGATAYGAFQALLQGLLGIEGDRDPAANTAALSARLATIARARPVGPAACDPARSRGARHARGGRPRGPVRRARLHGAVATLLDALLAGPTLVVLGTHWLDDASSELLRHLGERVTGRSWFVCWPRFGRQLRRPEARRRCPR